VTASLTWWRRIGLAFSTFFRILFDGPFAESMVTGRAAVPARPDLDRMDLARTDLEQPVPEAVPLGAPPAVTVPGTAPPSDASALVLLSLLQAEGRFVDFVQQEIAPFADADVGAVARVVHAGCRKVLGAHLRIAAIRGEAEGQRVALEPGFDPNHIKLTGNVAGSGRLSGVLRHRGWQATEVHLPTVVDRAGTRVLAPAEVEL
jgi:uncharacterized protein DUF2760